MSAPVIYSGPGKVTHAFGTDPVLYSFFADGENGQVKLAIAEKKTDRGTANHGRQRSTLDDQTAEISLTPFDSWALLPVLYPTYLGVTTGENLGALAIGTRPHDFAADAANGNAPTKVFTHDGRLYHVIRTAVTGHPGMKLGVGQSLFDSMKITGLLDVATPKFPGQSGALIAGNAITESAASDPDGAGFVPDFINGHWTGAWKLPGGAAVTGFDVMEVEDFWTLTANVKYSSLTVQKLTRHMKLDSVEFMIKGRLVGPTHTQLLGKILAHTLGGTLTEGAATDLVLSGPSSKTITLKNCEVFLDNSGFEFGGTKLNTGEVAFVSKMDFDGEETSVPLPLLEFSA